MIREGSITRNCQLSRICLYEGKPDTLTSTATVAKTVEGLHQNLITHPAAVQCRDFYAFGSFWISRNGVELWWKLGGWRGPTWGKKRKENQENVWEEDKDGWGGGNRSFHSFSAHWHPPEHKIFSSLSALSEPSHSSAHQRFPCFWCLGLRTVRCNADQPSKKLPGFVTFVCIYMYTTALLNFLTRICVGFKSFFLMVPHSSSLLYFSALLLQHCLTFLGCICTKKDQSCGFILRKSLWFWVFHWILCVPFVRFRAYFSGEFLDPVCCRFSQIF